MAARAGRRHGRGFDAAASVLIGVVVVGAALVPAVTANSGEVTTIRGDVSVGGRRLPFFPVGFWTAGDRRNVVSTSTTDANGVFTMDVPITLDGFAFAGTAPDASTAITLTDGGPVVRGTIGAKASTPVASPLYQGWESATGRNLAGGASELHFRLQEAGRIGGTSPIPASEVRALQVRRLDGSVVQAVALDARGRWRSRLLVPGRYLVAVVPKAPLLPTSVQVDVRPDEVVRAVLPVPQAGGTIDGTVRTDAGSPAGAVPVLLTRDDEVLARTTTDGAGTYRFTGLAAGDYEVEPGVIAPSVPAVPSPAAVPVPLQAASATPTPTPSVATGSPSPSPSPSAAVLEPVERTVDSVRPGTTPVTVPAMLGEVAVVSTVQAAGRVAGTVSGAAGAAVQVVVEDDAGRIVRATDAAADGRYSVGGLVQGDQYTVWAVTRPSDPTLAVMGSTSALATASTSAVDLSLDHPAASLQGTVPGATGGSVVLGDPALLVRSSTIDASGAYVVQGLVPGLFRAVVRSSGRLDADPVAVGVAVPDASVQPDPVDLQPGPRAATYLGWFISGGAGAPLVSGSASTADGLRVPLGPDADDGHLAVTDLRPGTYAYDADSFAGTVPAVDGPWWFDAPTGSFVLSDGATTDVGPVVLHVRAR